MALVMFDNYKNRPVAVPEVPSQDSMTEQAGYVPAKRKIEDMILAGQRLAETRKAQFDETEDLDPTRKPGLDIVEAEYIRKAVSKRLIDQFRAKKKAEKEALEAKAKTDPAPVAPGTP